uniref:Uncharacterized protein n=1 Tax=Wuchereria bancrofti TaxID=6293 RepID=A0AAF5Q566_WUCBA
MERGQQTPSATPKHRYCNSSSYATATAAAAAHAESHDHQAPLLCLRKIAKYLIVNHHTTITPPPPEHCRYHTYQPAILLHEYVGRSIKMSAN